MKAVNSQISGTQTGTVRLPCSLKVCGRRYAIAMLIAFLFLRSTAGSFWTAENRFFLHWQRVDTLGVLGAIALTGLAFLVAWSMLGRFGVVGRWVRDFAFVFIALQYARVNVAEPLLAQGLLTPWLAHALRVVHVALLAGFLFCRRWLVSLLHNSALLLSPILLVYASTLLTSRTYEPPAREELELQVPPIESTFGESLASGRRRVVIVIFDEWSFSRLFQHNGQVMEDYPELARVVAEGIAFTEAFAPAAKTLVSLPSILRGAVGESVIDTAGNLHVRTEERLVPFHEQVSILRDVRSTGGKTALVGNYLPYADLVGQDVDFCVSFDLYRVLGPSPIALCSSLILENLRIRLGFIHPSVGWAFNLAKHRYFANMAESIQSLALSLIRSSAYDLVFVHHSVPHMPFIFDRDGVRAGMHRSATLELNDYQGNLRYTDRLLGELYAAACEHPGDGLLLILTGDHSFREDPMWRGMKEPARTKGLRHVPLVILVPGAPRRAVVESSFELTSLRKVIAGWMKDGALPRKWFTEGVDARSLTKQDEVY